MMLTALGGGNLIHDVGYIESGLTASYEQLVAMDEIAGLVKRYAGGIEINADTMALDAIEDVGPGGHFLEHEHTFQHFRRNWVPELFDRGSREDWEMEGKQTMGDRAAAKVRDTLDNYVPPALDESIAEALDAVIQKAEERIK